VSGIYGGNFQQNRQSEKGGPHTPAYTPLYYVYPRHGNARNKYFHHKSRFLSDWSGLIYSLSLSLSLSLSNLIRPHQRWNPIITPWIHLLYLPVRNPRPHGHGSSAALLINLLFRPPLPQIHPRRIHFRVSALGVVYRRVCLSRNNYTWLSSLRKIQICACTCVCT